MLLLYCFNWCNTNTVIGSMFLQIGRIHNKILINTLSIPCKTFGWPYPGKATTTTRTELPSPTSACWVFSCLRNPPTLTCDHSYACIYIYTHGSWAHRQRVSTTFLTQKTHNFFLCFWRGSNLGHGIHWMLDSKSATLYQLSHPVSPHHTLAFEDAGNHVPVHGQMLCHINSRNDYSNIHSETVMVG